jgi:hypothetical protein
MTATWMTIAAAVVGTLFLVLVVYILRRFYQARIDYTFMTHNEDGFKRALRGKGVLWDWEESIVKGSQAPRIEFVALDPTNGQRKGIRLLDPRTGAVNLRPQFCVPLPFTAQTADAHRLLVEARVQFSLNRELMKYVYHMEDFGLALETRIQSAYRAEIGKRGDEVLRTNLHEVEEGVVARLRQAERDGDEAGELGLALGVNFHTTTFSFVVTDDQMMDPMALSVAPPQAAGAPVVAGEVGASAVMQQVRAAARTQGVLALRPQQLDLLADVFKGREPASTAALLTILEMQTRQNIAEALAGSGQLIVVTAEELGITGAAAKREVLAHAMAPRSPA